MSNAEVSIILPTYNESKNIRGILDHIKKSFPSNLKLETIIVDDNSPDNTAKIAEDYFHSIKEKSSHTINVIKRKAKNGLSSAILNGIQESSANTIVVMDSDFSHPPNIIPKLVIKIEKKNSGSKIKTITRKQQQLLSSKRSDLLNVKTCLF